MNIQEFITNNEGLIYKIAKRFNNIDLEDLYQSGVIGILKAYKNYIFDNNTKFSTYAYDYIFGEMYATATSDRNIKVSKELLRLAKKIETTRYSLAQKLNYVPSNDEVALYLEIDPNLVNKAVSVNEIPMSLDNDQSEMDLYEVIPEKRTTSIIDKLMIDESFQVLNDVETKIIDNRYYQDLTQSEVAKKLGLTQVMVSRYEKNATNKMKNFMTQ